MGAAGSTVSQKGEVLDAIKTLEASDVTENRELFQKRNKIDSIGEIVSTGNNMNNVNNNSNDKDKDDVDDTTSVLSYGDMGEDDLIENDLNEDIDILDTSMQSISSVKSAGIDKIDQNDKYSELESNVIKTKVDAPKTIQISKEDNINNYSQVSPPSKKSSPIAATSPTHRSPAHSISSIESTDAGMDTDISDTDNYMDNRVSKHSHSAVTNKGKGSPIIAIDSGANERNASKFNKKLSIETTTNNSNYRGAMPLSPIKESIPLSPINPLVAKPLAAGASVPTADSPTSQAVRAIVDGSTAFLFDLEDSNDSNLSINSKSPSHGATPTKNNDKQQMLQNNKQRKKSESRALSNNGFYMDYSQKIEEKNSSLLGLQRQKIWSYAQNAQLEREVELLQKQLEQIEMMEKVLDKKENNNKNIPLQQQQQQQQQKSPNTVPFKYVPSISNETRNGNLIPSNSHVVKSNDVTGHGAAANAPPQSNGVKNKVLIRSNPRGKDSSAKESDDETDNLLQEFGLGHYNNNNNKDYPLSISLNDYYVGADAKQLSNDTISKRKPNARRSKAIDDKINKINSNNNAPINTSVAEEELNNAIPGAYESDNKESKHDSFNANVPSQFKKNKNKNVLKNLNRRRRTLDGQLSDTGNDSVTEDEEKGGGGTDTEYYIATELAHPNNNYDNILVDAKHVNDSPDNNVAVKPKRRPRVKEIAEPKLQVTESASTLPDSKQDIGANNNISNSILAIKKKEREYKAMGDSGDQRKNKLWTRALDIRWSEVNLLLRRKIDCQEDIQYVVAAAEAGLMFTDQLTNVAKSLNVLRGTLSRWLLPYDNNTRIDEQCSTPHSVVENMPDGLRGRISERQVHYLVAGANSVRKLVRIKIADDNDLDQARQALKTAVDFFRRLQEEATKNNMTQFELLSLRDK